MADVELTIVDRAGESLKDGLNDVVCFAGVEDLDVEGEPGFLHNGVGHLAGSGVPLVLVPGTPAPAMAVGGMDDRPGHHPFHLHIGQPGEVGGVPCHRL